MRRLWLVLALLLAPSLVSAATGRVAVIVASQVAIGAAGAVDPYWIPTLRLMDRLGMKYDVYDCAVRTYGESGVADSTWFRERYDAVIVPYFQKNNNPGSVWYTGWRNAAATTGWEKGPIGGKWSIPVYGMNSFVGLPAPESHFPGTGDSLRFGVRITTNGSRVRPTAPESLGTWRDRQLSRVRSGGVDTLYASADYMTFRGGAFGSQVAAITWSDTVNTNVAATLDTIMSTWRYKPTDGPGIVWTTLTNTITASDVRIGGSLVLLEHMLREVPTITRAGRLPLTITVHHGQPSITPTAATDAFVDSHLDAFEAANLFGFYAQKVSPVDWTAVGAGGTTAGFARVREHLLAGFGVWHPHSHSSAWDYDETDSVGMRVAYNAMLNTASHPDSFNLPMSRYSPRRISPANDVMTDAAAKVASEAGMQVAEVLLHAHTTAADRFSLPRYSGPRLVRPVGTSNNVWLTKTFDCGFQYRLAAYDSSRANSDRIRSTTMFGIESAVYTGGSAYWHMDALTVPWGDGHSAWIIEKVIGSFVRQFSNVIEVDRDGRRLHRSNRSTVDR